MRRPQGNRTRTGPARTVPYGLRVWAALAVRYARGTRGWAEARCADTYVPRASRPPHTCYAWYIEELKKQEDNSRYLYEMQLNPGKSSGGDEDSAATRVFKRYKLSDEKQFSSPFSLMKES